MAFNPFSGGLRLAWAVVIGLTISVVVAVLDRSMIALPVPVFDADDLCVQSPAPINRDVIVTGTWTATAPDEQGDLRVVVCGHKGGRAVCHFENAAADRSRLERRLVRRCERVSARVAVLRNCQLFD